MDSERDRAEGTAAKVSSLNLLVVTWPAVGGFEFAPMKPMDDHVRDGPTLSDGGVRASKVSRLRYVRNRFRHRASYARMVSILM